MASSRATFVECGDPCEHRVDPHGAPAAACIGFASGIGKQVEPVCFVRLLDPGWVKRGGRAKLEKCGDLARLVCGWTGRWSMGREAITMF